MTKIINVFGGPSSGKSVAAMNIALTLKTSGIPAELVTEYAKDLTWEKRHETLKIQPYITVKQYRNIRRVEGQVDYVVTDGPVLMGIVYSRLYDPEMPRSYETFIHDLHKKTDSINIMLQREFEYQSYGRNQNYHEALAIDDDIRGVLQEFNVEVHHMKPTEVVEFVKRII